MPAFKDFEEQLTKYKGLNLLYSNQCPWVARSVKDLKIIADKNGLKLKIKELKNPDQAQNAPSVYSVFNLILNGKLLADHYISKTRFQNIINKIIK